MAAIAITTTPKRRFEKKVMCALPSKLDEQSSIAFAAARSRVDEWAASDEGQRLEVSFEPPVARVRPSVMQDLVAVTQQVERISAIEPSDFASRFEVPDRPCVLTGAVKTWRATQSWSAAYLKDKLGSVEVKYKLSASHAHPDFHQLTLDKMFSLGKSPFAEFLDEVTVGPPTERAKRLFTG